MTDILVLLALALVAGLICRYLYKRQQAGVGSCGGACASCKHNCPSKMQQPEQEEDTSCGQS